MRRHGLLPWVAFLVLPAAPAWATGSGKVVAVTDGDTVKVEIAGRIERVLMTSADDTGTVPPDLDRWS